jgi:release factor glutamine methyltransferase
MPDDPMPAVVRRLRAAGCVFAEDEAVLLAEAATSRADLDRLLDLRVSGLPLEHLVGWVEFADRRFAISPGVFVPRRRTELLARTAIAILPRKTPVTVVDMCCGCAALGATIASELPGVRLYAADIDPVAIRCARRNAEPVGGQVFRGDLYQALPDDLRGNVDQIVANAPYVPTDAIALMPPEARDYEPREALDGGVDGLGVLRRVVREAPGWLSPGGTLLVEVSAGQVAELVAVAESIGGTGETVTDEEIGGSVLIVRFRQR